mmetsp:Transcript_30326/g.77872  ORF Transcript_30326/g.77872 Transcript_30326/m.77872 type:complete len:217 (-) Transcript_30326:151-801(-)
MRGSSCCAPAGSDEVLLLSGAASPASDRRAAPAPLRDLGMFRSTAAMHSPSDTHSGLRLSASSPSTAPALSTAAASTGAGDVAGAPAAVLSAPRTRPSLLSGDSPACILQMAQMACRRRSTSGALVICTEPAGWGMPGALGGPSSAMGAASWGASPARCSAPACSASAACLRASAASSVEASEMSEPTWPPSSVSRTGCCAGMAWPRRDTTVAARL